MGESCGLDHCGLDHRFLLLKYATFQKLNSSETTHFIRYFQKLHSSETRLFIKYTFQKLPFKEATLLETTPSRNYTFQKLHFFRNYAFRKLHSYFSKIHFSYNSISQKTTYIRRLLSLF